MKKFWSVVFCFLPSIWLVLRFTNIFGVIPPNSLRYFNGTDFDTYLGFIIFSLDHLKLIFVLYWQFGWFKGPRWVRSEF